MSIFVSVMAISNSIALRQEDLKSNLNDVVVEKSAHAVSFKNAPFYFVAKFKKHTL